MVAAAGLYSSCRDQKAYTGSIVDDHSSVGHILRDGFHMDPSSVVDIPVVILGGGMSGLTAAYQLQKNNFTDYLLLELSEKPGGNSISGKNSVSAYPWAAHYLPIVNSSNTELINFLRDHNIITGFDKENLPIYNEYHLCFDPEERLFLKGHWQDGLIPDFGVNEEEKKEIRRFFKIVADYKAKTGSDGQPAFEIPVQNSTKDEEVRKLDKISFHEFLKENKFSSRHLLWYLNYCCKDDYGSNLTDTSAYAGLHYFCARRAKAANAESSAVLTWPEGNSFLAEKLYSSCIKNIKTNQLVTSVKIKNEKVELIVYNVSDKTCIAYRCDQAILSSPHYVNQRILSEELKSTRSETQDFEYSPWLVANITLTELPQHQGEPLSWDNVIYDSPSLGYVNACHQHLNSHNEGFVLTYYLPFSEGNPKKNRGDLREKKFAELSKQIVDDLAKAHPGIEHYITNIDLKFWGHGMIKPKPGFIFGKTRELYSQPIQDKLFFAHTDLSGISIFEEAFYQGTKAAKEILHIHDKGTKT